eukprot:SAG31_NODE_3307_length_4437_cov_10.156754_1_plen_106_part_00
MEYVYVINFIGLELGAVVYRRVSCGRARVAPRQPAPDLNLFSEGGYFFKYRWEALALGYSCTASSPPRALGEHTEHLLNLDLNLDIMKFSVRRVTCPILNLNLGY